MTQSSGGQAAHPGPRPGQAGRLAELCALLQDAGAGELFLEPTGCPSPDRTPLNSGWSLGGGDDIRRDAAAEIMARLVRAEEEIESLCAEILERYEEASLVYRLAERLGSVMGEGAIAELVLIDAARVLGARSGEIWLQRGRTVERVASVPGAPARPDLSQRGAFAALYERRPWAREARDDREAAVAVPLPDPDGEALGVIVLRGRSEGRSYRTGEIKLLTALANLTSTFIRNDRLSAKARRSDARKREDDIAKQIHQGLLPEREPEFPGLDIAGVCRSADTVGGDYYGYIDMADGGLGIAMADISGHGVGAGLYMAAAKGAIQAEACRVVSPSDLLRRINEALSSDFSRSDVFATAFFAHFGRRQRWFEYANGGHNPPILVRHDGSVDHLAQGGLALGVMPHVLYQEETRPFNPDDVLVIFTDGLVEARNESRQFYGTERLERYVVEHRGETAARLRDGILEDLDAYCGAQKLRDDVTLVVIRGIERQAPRSEVRDG